MSLILADKFLASISRVASIGLALAIVACGGGDTSTTSSRMTSATRSESAANPPPQSPASLNLSTQKQARMRALALPAGAVALPAIAAGVDHSLALKSDGTVLAWGGNVRGALGNASTSPSFVPVQVVGPTGTGLLSDVAAIAGGHYHSLAVKIDGTVWAWGYNSSGGLGNGAMTDSPVPVPVQVVGPGGVGVLVGVSAVAAGSGASVALKTDSTVWAWGGYLGNGTENASSTPVQVSGRDGVGVLADVTAIAMGASHTLALKSDGTLLAWGPNGSSGQLGNNSTSGSLVPVQVVGPGGVGALTGVTEIAASGSQSLAVRNDGTVWAWGWNRDGQLGNNSTTDSSVPVKVVGPEGLGVLTGIASIGAGGSHGLARKTDGTVWTWGFNGNGQLGNNTNISSPVAVQVVSPSGLGALTGVVAVAAGAGGGQSLALKIDGTVWAWGLNYLGMLGNNSTADSSVPVQVFGPGGVGFLNLGVGTPVTVPYYSITDLSPLLTSYSSTCNQITQPTLINNNGTVVGNRSQAPCGGSLPGQFQGYALQLGSGVAPSQFGFSPVGLNEAGNILGHAALIGGLFVHVGPPNDSIAGTTYLINNVSLEATAINNNDQAVGVFRNISTGERGATLYSNGQVSFLGSLPGASYSEARGINDSGTIVGNAVFLANCSANCGTAVQYINGSWQSLGSAVGEVGGGGGSAALGINNPGQIIGYTNIPVGSTSNQVGWILDGNSKIDIPLPTALNPGATFSVGPRVINNFGIVLGTSSQSTTGTQIQFVYSNAQSYDLNALIAPNSGWTITHAHDINDNGQIVAQAFGPDNTYRSIILEPTADNPFPRTGTAPILSLSSLSLDFGSVAVGSSKDLVLTVTNSGTGTLTGTAAGSGSFSVIAGAALNLTAGQSQGVTVRFAPVAAGAAGSQLLIATNAGNRSVPLSGSGSVVPQPTACASQSVPWAVGTSSCSATYPGGPSGSSTTLSDIIAPDTGTVTASCTNGQLTLTAPVCVTAPPPPPVACASQVLLWTVGASSCSATYPGGQSGANTTLSDIIAPNRGTVTASCTNGQLTLTAPVCVTALPPPPASCSLGASPTALLAGGGNVTLTASCAAGGVPSSYAWTGFSTPVVTTVNTVLGSITQTTTFSVVASNAGGNSIQAEIMVFVAQTKIENKCTSSSLVDFVLLPFYKSKCDLISVLRDPNGFGISFADATTDQLFNWLSTGKNEDATWALVGNIKLGSMIKSYLAGNNWDIGVYDRYIKQIKAFARNVLSLESKILSFLGFDSPALTFISSSLVITGEIQSAVAAYKAVAGNYSAGSAREILRDYINTRCAAGVRVEPCSANQNVNLVPIRQEIYAIREEQINIILCARTIFKCRTGIPEPQDLAIYWNNLELSYQAYRLVGYPQGSPIIRKDIGKALVQSIQ